jgi:hypothetical protein
LELKKVRGEEGECINLHWIEKNKRKKDHGERR